MKKCQDCKHARRKALLEAAAICRQDRLIFVKSYDPNRAAREELDAVAELLEQLAKLVA